MRKGELKTTTNIKMGKKETKEVLYIYIYFFFFFPFYGKLMKEKNFFWYIAKPYTFTQKSVTLYCFSFIGEGSVTL